MRKLLLSSALCAMALLATAPASWAITYSVSSCAEITTQESAQATLDDPNYGMYGGDGDELNLDPDGDGIACNNPGNFVGGEGVEEPEAATQGDLDCADFASQAEAQAVFDADPTDPNGLDADGDGVACESDTEGVPEPGTIGQAYGYQYPSQDDAAGANDAEEPTGAGASRIPEAEVAEEGGASSPEDSGEGETSSSSGINELPATGGVSLALGTGVLLLLSGGLVARRIFR